MLLHGQLAKAEPKTLHYRLLHVTARLARGRHCWLRIQHAWSCARALATAFAQLATLPVPAVPTTRVMSGVGFNIVDRNHIIVAINVLQPAVADHRRCLALAATLIQVSTVQLRSEGIDKAAADC